MFEDESDTSSLANSILLTSQNQSDNSLQNARLSSLGPFRKSTNFQLIRKSTFH
jgi:hypothetical protein